MPPKKEVKKTGAPVASQEEDIAELPNLPQLNMFGFQVCLDFTDKDNQEAVLKAIEDRLTENDKIK